MYHFEKFLVNGVDVYDNPLSLTLNENTEVVAVYKEVVDVSLQALINATPTGGVCTLGSSIYDVSSTVGISKNMTLDGADVAVVSRSGTALTPMLNIEATAITEAIVKRLKLSGNNIPSLGVRVRANGVVLDDVEIRDIHNDPSLTKQWWAGVDANGVTGLILRNGHLFNIQYSGLAAVNCPGALVEKTIFEYCVQNYPSGGCVAAQEGCDNFEGRYNTMLSDASKPQENDGFYLGQTAYSLVGAWVHHNTLKIYSSGAAGSGYAASGVKLYGAGTIEYNDIDWQTSPYAVGISLWRANVLVQYNSVRRGKYGVAMYAQSGYTQGSHTIQYNLLDRNSTAGIHNEQSGITAKRNKFVGNPSDYDGSGSYTLRTDNLYDKSATGRVKITFSSSGVSVGLIAFGFFKLAVDEVCYTESGSSIVVNAPEVDGYVLKEYQINGVSVAPSADGSTTVLASGEKTIKAVYVTEEVMGTANFVGKVSKQAKTGEVVTAKITKADSTSESVTMLTDAEGGFTGSWTAPAGSYSVVFSVPADTEYKAASTAKIDFTIALLDRTITVTIT